MDRDYISKRITELRMKKGISEYQLSTEIGKSKSYIQSITSKRAEPSLEAISDICNYFDISISDFFDEDMDANVLCHGIARKLSFLNDEQIDVIERTVDCFLNWYPDDGQ